MCPPSSALFLCVDTTRCVLCCGETVCLLGTRLNSCPTPCSSSSNLPVVESAPCLSDFPPHRTSPAPHTLLHHHHVHLLSARSIDWDADLVKRPRSKHGVRQGADGHEVVPFHFPELYKFKDFCFSMFKISGFIRALYNRLGQE